VSDGSALVPTPSQTVGPFFRLGLDPLTAADLVMPGTVGRLLVIEGVVYDGDGVPVPDALIETWQADEAGRYDASPSTRWFGRIATDDAGRFRLRTVMPGRAPAPGGTSQAPHIVVAIFMRGLLKHLVTRIYFADHPANADDPVLLLVDASRRPTLVANPLADAPEVYRWDVHLQGPGETVFFDL
jgi:protocatechuate 3,4-dioxygenase alpha subunit